MGLLGLTSWPFCIFEENIWRQYRAALSTALLR